MGSRFQIAKKLPGETWPGSSVGWSTIWYTKSLCLVLGQGTYLGCGFDSQSGSIGEATNGCLSLISMSVCLSLSTLSLPASSV